MSNKKAQSVLKELFIRCRKLTISFCFISQSYFNIPKEFRLNSLHYLIMKIRNRRELQQIAIDHFADIDYKDFLKIYRNCTKEPYSFLTFDTTLPASDPLRFRKNFYQILDGKIKANKSQYNLDREAAKISALSRGQLEKYEYLTGEDLGYKPKVLEKAKFQYSPL